METPEQYQTHLKELVEAGVDGVELAGLLGILRLTTDDQTIQILHVDSRKATNGLCDHVKRRTQRLAVAVADLDLGVLRCLEIGVGRVDGDHQIPVQSRIERGERLLHRIDESSRSAPVLSDIGGDDPILGLPVVLDDGAGGGDLLHHGVEAGVELLVGGAVVFLGVHQALITEQSLDGEERQAADDDPLQRRLASVRVGHVSFPFREVF